MTYHSSISRRGFLQSTAIGAAPLSAANRFDGEPEPDDLPDTDLIKDYLGVPALSYDDPDGEVWFRTATEDPKRYSDCAYFISQTIIAMDDKFENVPSLDGSTFIDARFNLLLMQSDADVRTVFNRNFESSIDSMESEADADDSVSTSQLSIGSYPGIFRHDDDFTIFTFPTPYGLMRYAQTFPWGMLQWEITYAQDASFELQVDAHQEFLRKRKSRDWDVPSLAVKPQWHEVHDNQDIKKGQLRGDISSLLNIYPGFKQMALERVDEQHWMPSSPTDSVALPLKPYR